MLDELNYGANGDAVLPVKPADMPKGHYSDSEEILNVTTHGIGFFLSIIGFIALTLKTTEVIQTVAVVIYGFSLSFMFLTSSIYHASKTLKLRAALRKVDHTAIYLLIAGSYTPFLLFTIHGVLSNVGLIVIWAIALFGMIFKLIAGAKYPKISVTSYAIMGWLAIFLIFPIYQSLSIWGFSLLIAGGICYSAGIPLYLLKSRHYSHSLWHLAVLMGAGCHFFTIYYFVI